MRVSRSKPWPSDVDIVAAGFSHAGGFLAALQENPSMQADYSPMARGEQPTPRCISHLISSMITTVRGGAATKAVKLADLTRTDVAAFRKGGGAGKEQGQSAAEGDAEQGQSAAGVPGLKTAGAMVRLAVQIKKSKTGTVS